MKILAVDVGGTHVKILATGQVERLEIESGRALTARAMASGVRNLAAGWNYDVVSIGYPGWVLAGRIAADPHNLAPGWIGFDFQKAFARPVKIVNDAAMQALGSYVKGTMLFLGLGTGLGSALVVGGHVVPMELAHLSYRKATIEDYLGLRGLERLGRKKWRRHVAFVIERFTEALHPDDIVIGGGNAKQLKRLPPGCRQGDNANAFAGGFRMWDGEAGPRRRRRPGKRTEKGNRHG